jgi:hypothetical protein
VGWLRSHSPAPRKRKGAGLLDRFHSYHARRVCAGTTFFNSRRSQAFSDRGPALEPEFLSRSLGRDEAHWCGFDLPCNFDDAPAKETGIVVDLDWPLKSVRLNDAASQRDPLNVQSYAGCLPKTYGAFETVALACRVAYPEKCRRPGTADPAVRNALRSRQSNTARYFNAMKRSLRASPTARGRGPLPDCVPGSAVRPPAHHIISCCKLKSGD